MTLYPKLIALGLAWLGFSAMMSTAAPLRVLYFSKSAGFEHSVVKRVNDQPSFSEKILTALGRTHGIEFTFSKDGSLFSREYLAGFDVILFFTSGNLLTVGTDGQPAMTPAGKQALLDAVAEGKGFVGLHAASDTFRRTEAGAAPDDFIAMVGGEFISHGAQQVARARVVDASFPGLTGLPAELKLMEEWYAMRDFPPDMHVLLAMETAGMKGAEYQRAPYPLAWSRQHGKGRVWFNALGHRDDVWESAPFQAMLVGGLQWAGRRVEADVTPNLAQVTPDAATLPATPALKK